MPRDNGTSRGWRVRVCSLPLRPRPRRGKCDLLVGLLGGPARVSGSCGHDRKGLVTQR